MSVAASPDPADAGHGGAVTPEPLRLCAHCGTPLESGYTVGSNGTTRLVHRDCWKCQHADCAAKLDLLIYWWAADGKGYCLAHSPNERCVLGSRTAISLPSIPDTLLADLAMAREEAQRAQLELDAFRERLASVKRRPPAESSAPPPREGWESDALMAGDRVDSVRVKEGADGALVSRVLVGRKGHLRLHAGDVATELAALSPPLWSAAPGTLRVVDVTVAAVDGAPHSVLFSGPVTSSDLRVWCATEAAADAWLPWARIYHATATITRTPAASAPAALAPPRSAPVAMRGKRAALGNLRQWAPTSERARPLGRSVSFSSALRVEVDGNALVEDAPEVGGSPAKVKQNSASSHSSAALPSALLSVSASSVAAPGQKRGTIGTWAKKLHLKSPGGGGGGGAGGTTTPEPVRRHSGSSSGSAKHFDVFAASLEELMAEQSLVFPNLPIPSLLNFLAEEVIRCGGMTTEGIFRLSTSHAQLLEITQAIKKARNFEYKLPPFKDPHIPAALLKQWLRDLPVPLFPDYDRCLALCKLASGSAEELQGYIDIMVSLSQVHRNVAVYLMEFLVELGHPSNVPHTKMPLPNLALVFVPSFLRCPGNDVTSILMNQPTEQKFVQTLVGLFTDLEWRAQMASAVTGGAVSAAPVAAAEEAAMATPVAAAAAVLPLVDAPAAVAGPLE